MKKLPRLTEDALYQEFRQVFEKHYAALCHYSFSVTGQKEASEDIVQEVFMKVWETRKDLIPTESVRFYLFAAVRNNSVAYLNKERRRVTVPFEPAAYGGEVDEAPEERSYSQILKEGIDTLPPKCKDVFLLSRMGKLSYQEIADNCGISVKTVENQVGKALKMLRAFAKTAKFSG